MDWPGSQNIKIEKSNNVKEYRKMHITPKGSRPFVCQNILKIIICTAKSKTN